MLRSLVGSEMCIRDRNAMDAANVSAVRERAEYDTLPEGVLRYRVYTDSDDDMASSAPASSTPAQDPTPSAVRLRQRLDDLTRGSSDTSSQNEDLPVVVFPRCIEAGCTRAGTPYMRLCAICDGHLHGNCGSLIDADDHDESSERWCSKCSSRAKGKNRSSS